MLLYIKNKISWMIYLLRNAKPYYVLDMHNDKGEYEYSVLCVFSNINTSKNLVRIRYDKNKCEIEGKVNEYMKKQLTEMRGVVGR